MGQKLSLQPRHEVFFCPQTGEAVENPLGVCTHCQAAHDIIWQCVYVCPNTGYRIETMRPPKPDRECASCFQVHQPFSKRVYICPVTGAQIMHPKETGGKCSKCSRTHEDNSTPSGSRVSVGGPVPVRR
ncbi:hypothetical protein QBC34DRAFT_25220 [Podospora aff. communis PSN243]|uniref:Uncharacterized protein n=1 Tax=Podospora aff. communis PSN243 TaxID=3040156 RepID=A0AAV9G5N4_9PEZI|nr:hypothetical protein QBC34DRAFT_25220 [Podospora aff. communis PSN243]